MKDKVIVVMSIVAAGVMTYLMFSGLDEGFYHFPWELFAGFGIMSWVIREGLKLVSDVKKEFEKCLQVGLIKPSFTNSSVVHGD